MDVKTIMRIKPELTRFLHQFDDCFGRITTRRYLDLYIEGQLSDLPRKSIEPMADAFGEPPRNLQQFLSLFRWDEAAARDRLQQYVARRHTHRHSVGVIDETSFAKKGNKTACIKSLLYYIHYTCTLCLVAITCPTITLCTKQAKRQNGQI